MAFELSLIVGSTTYSLSDGNPYRLAGATGLGLSSVQRFSGRYPSQDGYSDYGFVLEPRVVTLALDFVAASTSALDGYRDDLTAMFTPGSSTPLVLQVERDDGTTRRLDVVATALDIDVASEHRPGNLHRAAVQLRAADPIWYNPTPGTVTFGTTDISTWYLASSTIDESAVLEATQNPGSAQAWNWGTATQTTPYALTVAYRGTVTAGSAVAWYATRTDGGGTAGVVHQLNATANRLWSRHPSQAGFNSLADVGSVHAAVIVLTENAQTTYLESETDNFVYSGGSAEVVTIAPASSYWRGTQSFAPNVFTGLSHAATYNVALTSEQAASLLNAMGGTFDAYALGGTVTYSGNYDEYPTITLTGPLGDPVVTNVTTGRKLDLTGATIPAGVVYTIDLAADTLSITDQGGTIHTDELTEDSDLGNWFIEAGQSNYVQVTAATSGTASAAQIVYRDRYVSY